MSREVLVCVAAGVGWAVLVGLVAMLVVAWAIDVAKGRR